MPLFVPPTPVTTDFLLSPGWGGTDFISIDSLYPFPFDAPAAAAGAADYLQDPGLGLMADFFRAKGLAALKQEDRREEWYPDWIAYQAAHGLYAGLLSPAAYSTRGHRLNLLRLTRFLEAFAYFSPAHAYSLHVSFLGLFPILMSANEALKLEAIARLEGGGLFAFGVSERAHGADLSGQRVHRHATHPAGGWPTGPSATSATPTRRRSSRSSAKKGGTNRRLAVRLVRPAAARTRPALRDLRKVPTLGIRGGVRRASSRWPATRSRRRT